MSEASIMAIDPGTDESAYVIWNGVTLWDAAIVPNHVLIDRMNNIVPVYCEMIASYGMPVGREVFETCLWIGEFRRVCKDIVTPFTQVFRREVKLHHCNAVQAKDANVIRALKDKYGEKGTKKNPGITYPLKADMWQAFAIATMITEKRNEKETKEEVIRVS